MNSSLRLNYVRAAKGRGSKGASDSATQERKKDSAGRGV